MKCEEDDGDVVDEDRANGSAEDEEKYQLGIQDDKITVQDQRVVYERVSVRKSGECELMMEMDQNGGVFRLRAVRSDESWDEEWNGDLNDNMFC